MDEENNNQQSELENNPVTQMEAQIANKTVQQVGNIANNLSHKAKKVAQDAIKAVAKVAVKIAMKLGQIILKVILATAPVSFIVIGVIILAILIYCLYLSVFGGITTVFKNDVQTGDVSTSEIASIYDENTLIGDGDFTITATDDIVQIGKEIHDYINEHNYTYHNGNIMNYPNASQGIDCSAFVTWVLIQYGYTEFEGRSQLSTYDFVCWINGEVGNYDLSKYGWEWESTANATPEPGDLLLKSSPSRHIEIFAGDGVGTYGAGSNHQINATISYENCSTKTIINEGHFDYIIRIK